MLSPELIILQVQKVAMETACHMVREQSEMIRAKKLAQAEASRVDREIQFQRDFHDSLIQRLYQQWQKLTKPLNLWYNTISDFGGFMNNCPTCSSTPCTVCDEWGTECTCTDTPQPTNAEIMDRLSVVAAKLDDVLELLVPGTALADWSREQRRELYPLCSLL